MTRITNTSAKTMDTNKLIDKYIDRIKEDLWALNKQIHDNPEPALKEHKTHDAVTKFLEDRHCPVTRHAYGLETAFEARTGTEGRLVNFNSELDALPGLGHACGHNLICIAGVAAYYALSQIQKDYNRHGRVQLLGTPAEEAIGGKIILLDRGAYEGVDVSLMAHPSSELTYPSPYVGVAGQSTLANSRLDATYTGRSAHAAANPWDGINALDAVVASYNNISLLRQQIRPDQRIHGAILSTPKIANAIPEHTVVTYTVRTRRVADMDGLVSRVRACIEAGAIATGCTLDLEAPEQTYADIKVNEPLADAFARSISDVWGVKVLKLDPEPVPASTDMGNVTHAVPGLHANIGLPVEDEEGRGAFPHNHAFEKVAGTRAAFERFVIVAKALAATGLKVWSDDDFAERVKRDFERT